MTSLNRTHSPSGRRTHRTSCYCLHCSDLLLIIIKRASARKTKKSPTTPDLCQRNHQVGQAGSLAGVFKLWTSLGNGLCGRVSGKPWLLRKVTHCTAQCATTSSHSRPSYLGRENCGSATWWTAASSERPTTAPGIFSVA